MMKLTVWIALVGMLFLSSCDKDASDDLQLTARGGGATGTISTTTVPGLGHGSQPGSGAGSSTTIGTGIGNGGTSPNGLYIRNQVFFDGKLVNALMQELTPEQIVKVSYGGWTFEHIYATSDLHMPGTYYPVISGYVSPDQGPYWQVYSVVFKDPAMARQFTSAADLEAALMAGEIVVEETDAVYWYEVL